MDSNIEILFFILFVAFSILSSILDKKKKQKRKEQTKNIPKSGQVRTKPEAKSDKTPEELLREMFGLPTMEDQTKPQQNDPYSERSKEYYEENSTWNPEKEFKGYDEQVSKPEVNVNSREEAKSKYSNFIGKDFKTPSAEDEIHKLTEELFNVQKKAKKYSRSKVINQIKDPNSLKDYIVVSEILQKPISLR
jgi:hypothetical protein